MSAWWENQAGSIRELRFWNKSFLNNKKVLAKNGSVFLIFFCKQLLIETCPGGMKQVLLKKNAFECLDFDFVLNEFDFWAFHGINEAKDYQRLWIRTTRRISYHNTSFQLLHYQESNKWKKNRILHFGHSSFLLNSTREVKGYSLYSACEKIKLVLLEIYHFEKRDPQFFFNFFGIFCLSGFRH